MEKLKIKHWTYLIIGLLILSFVGIWTCRKTNPKTNFPVGQQIDSLNGVYVYYNGSIDNVIGRNTTADGYNLGLKYQCVEFVKRYYYELHIPDQTDPLFRAKLTPLILDVNSTMKRTRAKLFSFS